MLQSIYLRLSQATNKIMKRQLLKTTSNNTDKYLHFFEDIEFFLFEMCFVDANNCKEKYNSVCY